MPREGSKHVPPHAPVRVDLNGSGEGSEGIVGGGEAILLVPGVFHGRSSVRRHLKKSKSKRLCPLYIL